MMTAEAYETRYRGYVVRYRPQPMPDGRFLAYVVVGHEIEGLRAQISWTPELEEFRYKTDAALAGLHAGQAWVDAELAKAEPRASIVGRWRDVTAA
ncbi:MAG TPA: hypothetical protein VJO99_21205 [Burkholderiaceae bacterium]|nr:hypothetical protein [Burkholderiaceae bacterium]